ALVPNTLIAAALIAEPGLVTVLVKLRAAAEISAAIPACAANSAHSAAATDAACAANSAHPAAATDAARTTNTTEAASAACAACPVGKLRGPVAATVVGIVPVVVTAVREGVGSRNVGIFVVGNAGVVPPAAPGVVAPPAAAAAHGRAHHHADSE